MANYYEMLKVEPNASLADITATIDQQYNQWRRLVTHHDPDVVNQANQALRTLEIIRETLTNPDKRSGYDAAIGVSGPVGGLADPSAFVMSAASRAPVMTPPARMGERQPAPQPVQVQAAKENIWECYKCHADNPPHSVHCFKCGAELMRACPECNSVASMVATKMCGKCGYNYDIATQRLSLKNQITVVKQEADNLRVKMQKVNIEPVGKGCGMQFMIALIWISAIAGVIGLIGSSNSYDNGSSISVFFISLIAFVILLIWRNSIIKSQKNDIKSRASLLLEEMNKKTNELNNLNQSLNSLTKS
jgi:ribosomal protein L40E